MRIAFVTAAWPAAPDKPRGGVEAVMVALVRGLLRVRPDVEIHVIQSPASEDATAVSIEGPRVTLHLVRGLQNGLFMLPGLGPTPRVHAVLDRLAPDVVHVQAVSSLVDGRRYPSLLTVHGIRERDALFYEVPLRRTRAVLIGALERWRRKRFRHVIAIAGYVAQKLEGQVHGRTHFIRNPIEPDFYETKRRDEGPRILYVGGLIPRKNLHGILDAVGRLARDGVECTLRLAGPGPSDVYGARLRTLIDAWGIGDRVIMLGNLGRADLIEELSRARCLVLASFQETLPMAVAEAGAAGVPQVVSPAGGTAEMVVPDYTGMLVDAASPASIADGLRPLVADAAKAAEFGDRARAMARIYHPDVVARQTLEVYGQVASAR